MIDRADRGTLVTFDYEGKWGMPHDADYDLHAATRRILDVLARHDVHAMFFAVGRLIEDEPELVTTIAREGHAIGIHGYRHERLETLSPGAVKVLAEELGSVCELVERLTGSRPVAFRAPYLLGPKFFDDAIAAMLRELGFEWISNREVRFAEEVFRPDRMPWSGAHRFADSIGALSDTRPLGSAALAALNARHLWRDPDLGSLRERLRWLRDGRAPFVRGGLVEVALASPLDCDLLGLPEPADVTDPALIAYATECLVRGADRRGDPYVVTFHDWIIATSNRTAVLEDVLGQLGASTTMRDARTWRPAAGARVA